MFWFDELESECVKKREREKGDCEEEKVLGRSRIGLKKWEKKEPNDRRKRRK